MEVICSYVEIIYSYTEIINNNKEFFQSAHPPHKVAAQGALQVLQVWAFDASMPLTMRVKRRRNIYSHGDAITKNGLLTQVSRHSPGTTRC